MKITRNRVLIEPYWAQSTSCPESYSTDSIKTGKSNRSIFSKLFTRIFLPCSIAVILLSACQKTDELIPSSVSPDTIGIDKSVTAANYYVAPNGSDAATGDITHPFFTLNKAWSKVAAGDLVYMRGGTYAYNSTQVLTNKSGTAGNLIKIWAYPGEIPVITKALPFTDIWAAGISISGTNYLHLKGLEIKGFSQPSDGGTSVWPAIHVHDASHNIFELINSHDNGHGMVMRGDFGPLDDNLVLNCDFHNNSDPYSTTPYDNADGIEVAYVTSGTTTLRGCRAWSNSDDGFDLWANNGIVITEDCWSFWNGYSDNGITQTGIGEGFKAGGITCAVAPTILKRTYSRCLAFGNTNNGFADNNSQFKMKFLNCTAYHNVQLGTAYLVGFHVSATTTAQNIFTNCISYANQWTNGGLNDRPVYIDPSSIVKTSSFIVDRFVNPSFNVSAADFISLNPAGITGTRQADGSLPSIPFLHLAAGSDLINKGTNVGLTYSGSAPDLGTFEYSSTSSNNIPSIQNQSFSISKNSVNGSSVGTVLASDPDAGQTLSYSIQAGNTNGAFAINASTGALTVANSAAFMNGTTSTKYSVFSSAAPSKSQNYIGTGKAPLEVGMKFKSNTNGYVSGFRYYKGPGAQGTHIGNLWSLSGAKLASATFSGETASGWQTVTLSSPVAVTANTIYVVSYFSQHGDYVKTNPYFTANIVNGPLTALGWTSAQPNGIYRYTAISAFPNNNAYIGNTNYWADVIFSATSGAASTPFNLVVKVQDNGTGSLSSQANITVNLL